MLSLDVPRMKMLVIVRLDAQVTVVKREKRNETEEKDREVKQKSLGKQSKAFIYVFKMYVTADGYLLTADSCGFATNYFA